MSGSTLRRADLTELARHWPAVLACFGIAIFAWGFGFYGQSVYLAELHRTRGWSSALIGSAATTFYLVGAVLLTRVHAALDRFGPRVVLIAGVVLLGCGATLFSRSQAPWQLYAGAVVMACGWACTTTTAISTTLAFWFDSQRGLAISLALNGASAAGFTVAPLLVTLSSRLGLARAVPEVALAMLVMLVPLVFVGFGGARTRAAAHHATTPATPDSRPAHVTAGQVLRDGRFWSVSAPFALALAAQVGFLVHLVAFLLPHLGASGAATALAISAGAAMGGRIALGLIVDRLNQRRASALSFASQAAALGLMLALTARPGALYVGTFVFGLSVGNVITLPSLIVQREFAPRSFGLVLGLSTAVGQLTYSLGPTLLGVLRDLSGGYGAALALCIGLELAAALIVLRHP
jgi:MFS family permease